MSGQHYVILAAGIGSRLGRPHPKCLTVLTTGETILYRQLRLIYETNPASVRIVVGYSEDRIREAVAQMFPNVQFVTNPKYATTNTSKSLLAALNSFEYPENVTWLNGDVVFPEGLLEKMQETVDSSAVGVVERSVSEEEVKYTKDQFGEINQLSKTIPANRAVGEAVGINMVHKYDFIELRRALTHVGVQDYFEKAIERTIDYRVVNWVPFSLTLHHFDAVEVDFAEDLLEANKQLNQQFSSGKEGV
jgi:choline kinase